MLKKITMEVAVESDISVDSVRVYVDEDTGSLTIYPRGEENNFISGVITEVADVE